MEIKDHIIRESDKLFCQYGFKSVTMSDIASTLGISKKTIYQHFADKDDLVNTLFSEKLDMRTCSIRDFSEQSHDAIHEVFLGLSGIDQMLNSMSPKLFFDLQKYHVNAWMTFKAFKNEVMRPHFKQNLERGILEGVYRSDIETDLMTELRIDQSDLIFNDHAHYTRNSYTIGQVLIILTEHFLHGVASAKGVELITKYKNEMMPLPKANRHTL